MARYVTRVRRYRFAKDGDATAVTYDAELRLHGVFDFFEPGLRLASRWIGDRAPAGLRTARDGANL